MSVFDRLESSIFDTGLLQDIKTLLATAKKQEAMLQKADRDLQLLARAGAELSRLGQYKFSSPISPCPICGATYYKEHTEKCPFALCALAATLYYSGENEHAEAEAARRKLISMSNDYY